MKLIFIGCCKEPTFCKYHGSKPPSFMTKWGGGVRGREKDWYAIYDNHLAPEHISNLYQRLVGHHLNVFNKDDSFPTRFSLWPRMALFIVLVTWFLYFIITIYRNNY